MLRITITFLALLFTHLSFSQFTSTACTSGPLPISCANNTINLTSSFGNSSVTNPSTENSIGCSSVGSDITAGTIYDYDGWFTTTADAAGVVDVYAAIVTGDPVVGIYSGSCSSPVLLSCDDDGGTGLDANATSTGLTPGGTYYIRVWDYNGGTGVYNITSNGGTPPANDDCSNAEGVTVNAAPIGGTNYCSTIETGDWNDCESNTENNVWYSFTTTSDGDIIVNFSSVDCFGSGAGIDVSIFAGNCSSFATNGCTSVAAGSAGSIPSFYGAAGTYYIMVDGNNSGGATALCEFDIDVNFTGCPANAGTNTSPALIETCANVDINVTATGTSNTNIGTDPCIGWGFWVVSDPLGVYPGMTGLGNTPTGNNPAGSGGDENFAGVWTSIDYPSANGENATLPAENNGVTYYIAPITLSNCQTGEITTNCFDIGNITQVYYNPEINFATVIDCFNVPLQQTQVAIAIGGGSPSVNGSNFTLTNLGAGILSSTTVADGGTVFITAVPNNGTVSILVTDDKGCTETITLSNIDATAYCPACGVDAGNVTTTQTGSGNTIANNGTNGTPFVLCFGDNLDLTHLNDYILPPDANLCGDPAGAATFDYATAGSCNPGIVFGIFTDYATTANPFDDAINFSGYGFVGEDQAFLNDGILIASLIANSIPIVDNTFYLYPVTADVTNIDIDGNGTLDWSEDIDSDGCIDSGNPIAVTMLNPLNYAELSTCNGPQITLTGGASEFFTSGYAVVNNGSGSIIGTPVSHGGTITITGLSTGDTYDITVTDGNGCSTNITGTFTYVTPILAINNLATDFCLNDPIDAFNVTPTPLTVTTGSFDIDFISDAFTAELSWTLVDASGNVIATGGPYGGYANGVALPTELVSGLDPADGPFSLILNDTYGDGQDGTSSGGGIGTTTVTNNVTGQIVATTAGNWGSSITLNLGGFVSTTVSIGGISVIDNGNATGTFNPNIEGTHTIGFTYNNGEGCTYNATQSVTVHPTPILGPITDPVICAGETILLSNYAPNEAEGLTGSGTWFNGTDNSGSAAPTTAFTPADGAEYYYQFTTTAGGCITGSYLTVTVNPLPTVTASNNGPVCVGSSLTLTGGSNGMTSYSWNGPSYTNATQSPTISASATSAMAGTYTITVNDGNCVNTATTAVVVNPNITPTFTAVSPICSDATLSALPTTSNNSITGTWAPALNNTATTTYTFTPTTGQCATSATLTITVNPNITPTFTAVTPICSGATLSALPTTSNNSITGTWTPALNNTATTTYTFTPTTGQCATTTTMTITVNPTPTASVTGSSSICIGANSNLSPTTGGTWTSSSNTIATVTNAGIVTGVSAGNATFTFTTTAGCPSSASTAITVNSTITPTFTAVSPICSGATLSALPATSNNSITGTWAPALNNTATTTYTFTPTTGQCATSATLTITVNPNITPTFTAVSPICNGATLSALPTTSNNSITGTWTPALNNTATTTYTFTPTSGQCATTTTLTITVNPLPTISASANTPCVNSPLILTGSTNGTTFAWSGPNSFTSTSSSPTVSSNATIGMAGAYTLTVSNGTCTNSTTVSVTINALPVFNITGINETDPSACAASDGSITGITASGAPTLSYSWNGGASQSLTGHTGLSAGNYTIVVTDGNMCTASAGPFSLSDPTPPTTPTISLTPGSVCVGGDATIAVSSPDGSATYTWSGPSGYTNTGSSITLTNLTSADAGTYDVSTTISGCTVGNATSPVTLTVNNLPVVDVLTPLVVNCNNPIVTLDGSNSSQGSNITYTWNASNGGILIGAGNADSDNTSTAGDYELEIENTSTGCINSQTVSVTTNMNTPISNIVVPNGGQLDCANPTLTLDGTNSTNDTGGNTGISYTWSTTPGGSDLGTATTQNVNAAGDYYLTIEETISGCTDEMMVTINAATGLPNAVITGNTLLTCTTLSITIDGSTSTPLNAVDYEWNTSPATTILGTGSSINITTAGDYSLTVTDPLNSCNNSIDFTVTEDITTPSVSVITPLIVDCNNTVAILDGSASDQGSNLEYAWSNNSTGVIIGAGDNYTDSTSTADTYTLTVLNTDNGCEDSDDVIITMDTIIPIANAGSDINFPCGVTTVVLDGSASTGTGITYDWSGSGTITNSTTSTPNVSGTGTFTLTVTSTNGCSNTATVDVIPDVNAPTANAGSDIVINCNNIVNPFSVDLDGTNSDSGMNYSWSTSGSGTITNGNTTTPSVDQAGTYTILVTNTSNSCTSTSSVIITMDTLAPTADAGTALSITCASGLVQSLDATNSIGSGLTYSWSTANGTIDNQSNGLATVSSAGDYEVVVTQINGCTDAASITITMDTVAPIISIINPGDIDCNGNPLVIDASGSTGTNETYLWSTNETSNSITVTIAGTYTLTIENDNGCSSSTSVTINSTPAPVANFTATPISGQVPLEVNYTNNSTGTNLTYIWNFGDGNSSTILDPTNTFNDIGDFTTILTVTDAAGCTDTASININVTGTSSLIIPNIFTPNGDNVNDIFNVDGTNITNIKGTIINRWGQVIYEWNVLEIGWDGHTFSGAVASEGTYYYLIDAEGADGTIYSFQGPFQLIR